MKSFNTMKLVGALLAGSIMLTVAPANAQFGGPPPVAGPARDVAPFDLSGQWVSVVTEDWRFRMVTPRKNDFPGLPLNAAARAVADAWDPAIEEANGTECKSYGAGGIMRVPGRLRISWDDDSTLEIQLDAGRQTRTFYFDGTAPQASGAPSWQGHSVAEWQLHRPSFRAPPVNGTIKVVTTGMRPGYFRKNGVPYGEGAILTEYFDLLTQQDGSEWLQVMSILEDPAYFTTPIITSTNFKRQANRSGWNPQDCSAR